LIPDEPDRTVVHEVIYGELVRGVTSADSKREYLRIIDGLRDRGARGVIAGCTEIELLVDPGDVDLPYFPTTLIHATAAAEFALGAIDKTTESR
jgi:aspartate racemase